MSTPNRFARANKNIKLTSQKIFEAYHQQQISLNKLAELLEIPVEEAKVQVQARGIPLHLGVKRKSELLSDIENA